MLRVRRKKRQVLKDKFSTQKLEIVLVRYYYLRMDFSIMDNGYLYLYLSLERFSMRYRLLSHTGFWWIYEHAHEHTGFWYTVYEHARGHTRSHYLPLFSNEIVLKNFFVIKVQY